MINKKMNLANIVANIVPRSGTINNEQIDTFKKTQKRRQYFDKQLTDLTRSIMKINDLPSNHSLICKSP
jgi:hypothetical protein